MINVGFLEVSLTHITFKLALLHETYHVAAFMHQTKKADQIMKKRSLNIGA